MAGILIRTFIAGATGLVAALGIQSTVLAEPAGPSTAPQELHFCAANCFTLQFKQGMYVRADGSAETWSIERFSGGTVILHRHDPPAKWNLFQADSVYKGTVSGDHLVNITIAGQAAPPIVQIGWGGAQASVPGNNAERFRISDARSSKPDDPVQPFGVTAGQWEIIVDRVQKLDSTAALVQSRKAYDALEAQLSPQQRAAVETQWQEKFAELRAHDTTRTHQSARYCLTAHGLHRGYVGVFDASNLHADGCHGTAAGSAKLLTAQITCPQSTYTAQFEAIDTEHFNGSMVIVGTSGPTMTISNSYHASWLAATCPTQSE